MSLTFNHQSDSIIASSGVISLNANTGALTLPTGNGSSRPAGVQGMIRYSTTNNGIEVYNGTTWTGINSGVSGPSTSVNNAIAVWNGTGGTNLISSSVSIDGFGNITNANSITSTTGTISTALIGNSLSIGAAHSPFHLSIVTPDTAQAYIASTGSNECQVYLDNQAGGQEIDITYLDAGTQRWSLLKNAENGFGIYDRLGGKWFLLGTSGSSLQIGPALNVTVDQSGNLTVAANTTLGTTYIGYAGNTNQGNLQVYRAINGSAPANTGSTDSNQVAVFNADSVGLRFGFYNNGVAWIQNSVNTNYSGNVGIALNPNGGSVTAPNPTAGDNSTNIATTAYVQTPGYNSQGVKTVSTAAPSGGNNGDIWYQV